MLELVEASFTRLALRVDQDLDPGLTGLVLDTGRNVLDFLGFTVSFGMNQRSSEDPASYYHVVIAEAYLF